jgi:hypothetical protein
MMEGAPPFDRHAHSAESRTLAARVWQSLLIQEDRSREAAERLVVDLDRFAAPRTIVERARIVTCQEARHVAICAHMVRALGFQPLRPPIRLPAMPQDDDSFERAMLEVLVAGFAVAETMSVGGFAAALSRAREPLARWAIEEILRDEVGHGAFGEDAGRWAMSRYGQSQRRALWPACVAAMEALEERTGGPVGPRAHEQFAPSVESLGAPAPVVVGRGMLRATERWVLPRLGRMGVLPTA